MNSSPRVVFIQPASFLRSAKRTNPFFDPIIKCCQRDGIKWCLWYPKWEKISGYPSDCIRQYSGLVHGGILFWKMCHLLFPWLSVSFVYRLFGKMVRHFYKDWISAEIIITIAGVFANELQGIAPSVRVVDLQHGVIWSTHRGYFVDNGLVAPALAMMKHREFWLYGYGYADCFFKNPENHKWLDGRVHVIGDVVRAGAQTTRTNEVGGCEQRNIIAFSGQLTADLDVETLKEMVKRTMDFFETMYAKYGDKYRYVMKQHPRFNNVCDISVLRSLPYLEYLTDGWSELWPQMALHVTFSSTVIFDAAASGVPTYLEPFKENNILDGRSYYGCDFRYPYESFTADEILTKHQKEPDKVHGEMLNWFHTCYTPFDEANCQKLLGLKEDKE